MNLAQTIYARSLRLPEAAAREALDFIDFWGNATATSKPKLRTAT